MLSNLLIFYYIYKVNNIYWYLFNSPDESKLLILPNNQLHSI